MDFLFVPERPHKAYRAYRATLAAEAQRVACKMELVGSEAGKPSCGRAEAQHMARPATRIGELLSAYPQDTKHFVSASRLEAALFTLNTNSTDPRVWLPRRDPRCHLTQVSRVPPCQVSQAFTYDYVPFPRRQCSQHVQG